MEGREIDAGECKISCERHHRRGGESSFPHALTKGINLCYQLFSTIPESLSGDQVRLKHVLSNLLNSAIKFTVQGEVFLSVKKQSLDDNRITLKFSIAFTGTGIACEEIERIFGSIYQADVTTCQYGNTELGLITSKQLVQMMGGTINVASETGRGSAFHFILQFSVNDQPDAIPVQSGLVPRKILLVEDDQVNRLIMTKMIQIQGHSLDVAINGFEALEFYSREKYDLILMDIQMPGMDGIETTRQIRGRENWLEHVPIIALTAYFFPGDREKFLTLGMDEYLCKPVRMEELFMMIENVAEKHSAC